MHEGGAATGGAKNAGAQGERPCRECVKEVVCLLKECRTWIDVVGRAHGAAKRASCNSGSGIGSRVAQPLPPALPRPPPAAAAAAASWCARAVAAARSSVE